MNAEIVKSFFFEAAHRLPNVPADHKCSRIHGHSYRVDVHVAGPIDPRAGWVMDFGDLKAAVEPVLAELDHRCLNDLPDLPNATAEHIAAWLWNRLVGPIEHLVAVVVWESDTSRCIYRGKGCIPFE